jgi:signal transduction histidine kinase/DNA-binding response OmpR family regulator
LDRKTEKFKQYKYNPKIPNCISSDNVKFVNQDYKGRIWVATEGGGLCLLDKKTNSFKTYTTSDGLPSNSIYGILSDENNRFWLSTKKGISTFHPDSMVFTNYTVADGLQANAFNIQSFCKNPLTNELFFGGPGGFTQFHPKQITKSSYIPQVYFTSLKIGNQPVNPGNWKDNREILKKAIIKTDSIELKFSENSISLEFVSLHYSAPENIKYRYLLDGFDENWSLTNNKQNYANYTNLPVGKYVFRLQASNCDGIWNTYEKKLFIKIVPPWYKTTWFRILLTLFFVITTSWLIFLRIFYLEKARNKLKILVQQKTVELSETNVKLNWQNETLESINQSLKEQQTQILKQNIEITEQREHLIYSNEILKNKNTEILNISKLLHESDQSKIRFFTNISHELRTPFSLILGPLESLIEKNMGDNQLNGRLTVILDNSKRLLRLINQMLDFKNIDNNTLALTTEQLDIIAFSRNIYDAHRLIAEKKNIKSRVLSNRNAHITWFDPDKVDKILYNILSNAFKFTPDNGEITLECAIQNTPGHPENFDSIEYTIQDTGIGIDKENLNKIFDRFFQVDQSDTRHYEGSGIGLSLTKHLVELHKGSIQVASELQKGTCFIIKLDIGEHLKNKPLDSLQSDIENPAGKGLSNPKGKLNKNKPLVLIVEDNEELRSYISEELAEGYEILEAEDGKTGYDLAYKFLPDIILSDVMMPVMDGFEMCESLKNEWITSHIPIIILTAKADETSHIQGLGIGADAYIKKPFQINHLKAQIENLIISRKKLQLRFNNISSKEIHSATESKKDAFLNKVTLLIEENISNTQFGVEILAGLLNMSRSKLYKKTYALINVSAGELIRDIRLKKAAQLLQTSDHNITEVATMVGFSDHPQFTRSFTHQFGMSPKKYQNRNQAGDS